MDLSRPMDLFLLPDIQPIEVVFIGWMTKDKPITCIATEAYGVFTINDQESKCYTRVRDVLVKMPISYISSTRIRPAEVMKSKYRIILHLVDDLPMDDYADIFLEPSVSRHQADLLIRNQIYRDRPS